MIKQKLAEVNQLCIDALFHMWILHLYHKLYRLHLKLIGVSLHRKLLKKPVQSTSNSINVVAAASKRSYS
jgi:hypothetical protein